MEYSTEELLEQLDTARFKHTAQATATVQARTAWTEAKGRSDSQHEIDRLHGEYQVELRHKLELESQISQLQTALGIHHQPGF